MEQANPIGTNGFDFLEFSTHEPEKLKTQWQAMGFHPAAKHRDLNITLYQQGNIRFYLNESKETHAHRFQTKHRGGVSAMGFNVKEAEKALAHVISQGATPYQPAHDQQAFPFPAIHGIGETLIYFVDDHHRLALTNAYTPLTHALPDTAGLTLIDHVTHNVQRGHMDTWADFYTRLFNFHEMRYFDIEGKVTGLKSRAMASPCGKIRIPLNESSDDQSQIEEFLREFNGEGIQHIALGTDDIYHSVRTLRNNHIQFLNTPDTYYELLDQRLPGHGEPLALLKELSILLDGRITNEKKCLLQIFTQNMIGPVFFELIQRKGDEGFGEGNFRALFESIELDQIRRGIITLKEKNP